MRLGGRRDRERVARLEMTSLVDVVFLLIIFFLTTSSLVELTKANIELAKAAGEDASIDESSALVININASGGFIVENEVVALGDLMRKIEAEIAKSGPERVELLVRADRRSSLSSVNRLAEELVSRDVTKWRLATEVPLEGVGP